MGWEAHTVGGWHMLGSLGRWEVGEWRGWPCRWLGMREGRGWGEGGGPGGWVSWSGVGQRHCDSGCEGNTETRPLIYGDSLRQG